MKVFFLFFGSKKKKKKEEKKTQKKRKKKKKKNFCVNCLLQWSRRTKHRRVVHVVCSLRVVVLREHCGAKKEDFGFFSISLEEREG